MKKHLWKVLFLLAIGVFVFSGIVFAQEDGLYGGGETEKEKPVIAQCPKTKVMGKVADCLTCHTAPNFKLKEAGIEDGYNFPNNTSIREENGKKIGYYFLSDINDHQFKDATDYIFKKHNLDRLVVEISSPGGSLFAGWRIVGLMQDWIGKGKVIETRVYGFAMSAGFLIFASGSKGHRLVSKTGEFMWHELLTFSMFKIDTPSSTEEQSRILRHLQDTGNSWLASVSSLTKEGIDELVHKKEYWLRGVDMVKFGFADGFL